MTEQDNFYLQYPEPEKSCLLALRMIILSIDEDITAEWKYAMPFFCYKGKMFCYIWFHKKYKRPYIGIVEGKRVEHPLLITEKRSRMKIMLFNPNEDLPVTELNLILNTALIYIKRAL